MKVAIAGAGGRMGRALLECLGSEPGLALGAAIDAGHYLELPGN